MAAPKQPGARRRRNVDQSEWRQLPVSGSGRRAPALPRRRKAWLAETRRWWKSIWASPMAAMWIDADLGVLYRLAVLRDLVWREPERSSLQGEITRLEDRLGLSPRARRMLQWEIARTAPTDPPAPGRTTRPLRSVRAADE